MKKELPHFLIGSSYGGNQEWFKEFSMRVGGCAAETACDICIYLDLYKETALYPYDIKDLTKSDYVRFGSVMKPFLHPRMSGIDKLSIFTEGFENYVKSAGGKIKLTSVEGNESFENAKNALINQLDKGLPVAYLNLMHKDEAFKDYKWHWFLINGYEITDEGIKVKAVTYSAFEWLDFQKLWNTGYSNRGGMVLIDL